MSLIKMRAGVRALMPLSLIVLKRASLAAWDSFGGPEHLDF